MEEEKSKQSTYNSFNHLILLTLAKYLHPQEIVNSFLKLNRASHKLGTHNALWRKILIYQAVAALRDGDQEISSKEQKKGGESSDQSFDDDQHEEKKMSRKQKEVKHKYLADLRTYFGSREPNYYEYYLNMKNLLKGIYRSDGKVTQCLGHTDSISAIHSEGRQFVTGSLDKRIIFWKLGKKRKGHMFQGHTNAITGLLLFPQFNKFISCSADRSVRIWDFQHIEDAEEEKYSSSKKVAGYANQAGSPTYPSQVYQKLKSAPHLYGVKGIRKIDESPAMTYSSEDKLMCVWDIKNVKLKLQFHNNWSGPLNNIAVSSQQAASVDEENIFINDLENGKEVLQFKWAEDDQLHLMPQSVNSIIFSSDDPNTLFIGTQGVVKRFDLRSPMKKATEWGKTNPTGYYKLEDFGLLKQQHYSLLTPGVKATRPLKMCQVENSNLLVSLLNSSKGVTVHDLRYPEKVPDFHKTLGSEVTCLTMGKSTETKAYAVTGGIENELKVVDVRRAPDDQYFKGKGKLIPHLGSSMTRLTFQDEFIACGAKDGSVSVMEFTGRKKNLEPKVMKINAYKQ